MPYWVNDALVNALELIQEAPAPASGFLDVNETSDDELPMDVEFVDAGMAVAGPTIQEQLTAWGVATDASSLGCMLLPRPIVKLIERGQWRRIFLLTRWHSALHPHDSNIQRQRIIPGPIKDWPPAAATIWDKTGTNLDVNAGGRDFTAETCRQMAEDLSSLAPAILDEEGKGKLVRTQATLRHWFISLLSSSEVTQRIVAGEVKRFRHDSRILLQTIKLAAMVQGGASRVADVCGKALSMLLPPAMQSEFLAEVSKPGDEMTEIKLSSKAAKKIPAASLVNRYELSFDLAIQLLAQLLGDREETVKAMLSDSSPIGGHDWLWSMWPCLICHEPPENDPRL